MVVESLEDRSLLDGHGFFNEMPTASPIETADFLSDARQGDPTVLEVFVGSNATNTNHGASAPDNLVVQDAENNGAGNPERLPGLNTAARITRDTSGIAHIRATNEHDLYFLQGFVHAEDRLFQMDVNRRLGSGTLAELLGSAALPSDVEFRTIGLRRAAERSLEVLSPRARAVLDAYAEGVNAYVSSNPLPPEYAVLELNHVAPWTPTDSLVIGKLSSFVLSFDLEDISRTVTLFSYVEAGLSLGFDGEALFFEDLFRAAPFDPASTIPDASVSSFTASPSQLQDGDQQIATLGNTTKSADGLSESPLELAAAYLDRVSDVQIFQDLLDSENRRGSNEWAISGEHTDSGRPLLANDPHLALGAPSTFYPVHLKAAGIDVAGESFAGAPAVVIGQNRHIAWGATVNPLDVTDVYQELVLRDPASPSGLSIVHEGVPEAILPIPEQFYQNNLDGIPDNLSEVPSGGPIPAFTLIVPRRNNGPILQLDIADDMDAGVALSVQYTGFSGSRELDGFLALNDAENLNDFQRGLQWLDVGSQNYAYADVHGNIAYFASGEMPLREDLQAGTVNGLPPYFIRVGTGGNEWLPVQNPQPGQAVPFEILPAEEMPQIVNPPAGWFVNSNNDPVGTSLDNDPLNQLRPGGGIYYLNPGYSAFQSSLRAGRIKQLLEQKIADGMLSFEDMQETQANTQLLDAEVLTPYILQAQARAQVSSEPALAALGSDAAIAEATRRLEDWDFSTPTGIPEGYDASDVNGVLSAPSKEEIAASVSATIYSVWRGQFIGNTLDTPLDAIGLPRPGSSLSLSALRNLLDNFDANGGVGASGLNFFNVPGVADASDRRDIVILQSLADSLNLLAGPEFAPAFGGSTDLDDYRWGKLHRIVFDHPLGEPFSVPPAAGLVPPPLPGLEGISVDGGFGSVDQAAHDARAASYDEFMFELGPARRYVVEVRKNQMRAVSSLPGGTSGIPSSPFYVNLLPSWLTNDVYQVLQRQDAIARNTAFVRKLVPANGPKSDSGLNFVDLAADDQASDRRDILMIQSLLESSELRWGPEFALTFDDSTDLDDDEWRKLHRGVFDHLQVWPNQLQRASELARAMDDFNAWFMH